MNNDDIIRLAREAGYFLYDLTETHGIKTVETDEFDEWVQLERFAALVAAHERDACAKVADEIDDMTGREIAANIRARGEA